MNLADVIVSLILIGLLFIAFRYTKQHKDDGCSGCKSDCSTCHTTNIYEEYMKDKQKKSDE